MFKLVENYEYEWPVIVQVPVDGGKHEALEFTARFLAIESDRAEELLKSPTLLAGPSAGQIKEFLREAIVGWGEDVADKDGASINFSDKAREKLIQIPYVRNALFEAYGESVRGRSEKN